MCLEMYVLELINIFIEKINYWGEVDLEVFLWFMFSENDIVYFFRDMGYF